MTSKTNIQEIVFVLGFAVLSALLLFLPSLSLLGGEDHSLPRQLYEAFFHSAQHERLLGEGADPLGSFWIVGFVEGTLSGEHGALTDKLYAPFGLDLGMHEGYAWLDTLFAMPLRWLIGSPGFYNLHVLCTLILSFLGCYWLFRSCTSNRWWALVAAHLSIVNEFVYQEISYGRPTQVNWLFAALFAGSAIQLVEHPQKWHWALIGGVMMGAFCLIYWFGAASLGFVALFYLFYGHARQKAWGLGLRNALLMLAGVMAVILPVCWRLILPILQGVPNSAYASLLSSPKKVYSVLGLSLPVYSSEMILSLSDLKIFVLGRHYPIFLLLFALVATVLLLRRKHISTLLFLILALLMPVGSALTLWDTIIPMPFSWLEWIFPPMVRCNFPDRLMFTPLAVVLLVISYGHKPLLEPLKRLSKKSLSVLILGGLMGNLLWVWHSHTPDVTDFTINKALVKTARQAPGGFIEFPFDRGNLTYVQNEFHQQQVLTGPGMMMIHPPESKRYIEENGVLSALNKVNEKGFNPRDRLPPLDVLELQKDGFRHLVLYLDEINQPVRDFERLLKMEGIAYPEYGVHIIPLPEPK